MSPEMGMTASSRRPWRQVAAAVAVICVGVGAVALIVGHAQLSASQQVYMLMPKPQLTTELWFGPGISDDLNRMVAAAVAAICVGVVALALISHPVSGSCSEEPEVEIESIWKQLVKAADTGHTK
ncbi:hypothetical protein T484DRAFT_1798209 [Baffinella frigidus]|nr:hypothetical protein T484DRAFT_1798209 [Cryptophyta sp. CCMP2293]